MKTRDKVLVLIFSIIIGIQVISLTFVMILKESFKDGYLYPAVSNAELSVGEDSRYQIVKENEFYILTDRKIDKSIEWRVYYYYNDVENSFLYTIGRYGYTILDYANCKVRKNKDIEMLNREEQDIFNEKEKFVSLVRYDKMDNCIDFCGDGRFQIIQSGNNKILVDNDENINIEIDEYTHLGHKFYIINKNKYIIIDYSKTDKYSYKIFNSYQEVDASEKMEFEILEK